MQEDMKETDKYGMTPRIKPLLTQGCEQRMLSRYGEMC